MMGRLYYTFLFYLHVYDKVFVLVVKKKQWKTTRVFGIAKVVITHHLGKHHSEKYFENVTIKTCMNRKKNCEFCNL